MTHILFSIRTFIVAFVFLASSLIIRPMLSDPAPVKVDAPVESEQKQAAVPAPALPEPLTAMPLAELIERCDLIVVGRMTARAQLSESAAQAGRVRIEVVMPLKGEAAGRREIALDLSDNADHEALYLTAAGRQREAIFFLRKDGTVYVPANASGLVAVDRGQLYFSDAFLDLVDVPASLTANARDLADFIRRVS